MNRCASAIAEVIMGRPVASHGGNYLVKCPAHDDRSPSLSLRDGEHGLLIHCFAGCSPADVFVALRRIDQNLLQRGSPAQPVTVKGSSEHGRRQHDKAAWLWSQRRSIVGSIAECYLRHRGITCPLPPTLAFLPPRKPEQHAAMIAPFTLVDESEPGILGAPRNVQSVHLTLLKPDGTGKAEVNKPKLIVGSPGGFPIIIAPPNDLLGMAVTEGIEDGLSVHQATGLGVWVAGAAGFMPKLAPHVPNYIETITIFAHDDRAGLAGAYALANELHRRGVVEVRVEVRP